MRRRAVPLLLITMLALPTTGLADAGTSGGWGCRIVPFWCVPRDDTIIITRPDITDPVTSDQVVGN